MRWRRGHPSFRKTKGKNASRPETEDLNTRTISLDDLKRLRTIRALLASSSPIRLETEESTASLLQEMAVIFARVNAGHEGANLPMEESKPMSVICDEDAAGQSSGKPSAVVTTRSGSKDNADSLLHIPPTAWGHALEYLYYDQVRSALTICKTFRKEVHGTIQVLNFTKGSDIGHSSSGRYFPHVEEVNCLSFVTSGALGEPEICKDTTTGLVPFLMSFPNLRRITLGKLISSDGAQKSSQSVIARSDYGGNERYLEECLYQLLSATKNGLLPPTLECLDGAMAMYCNLRAFCGRHNPLFRSLCSGRTPRDSNSREDCRLCRSCKDLIDHIPLRNVAELPQFCECVMMRGRPDEPTCGPICVYERVALRDGGRKFLGQSEWFVDYALKELLRCFDELSLKPSSSTHSPLMPILNYRDKCVEDGQKLCQKLVELGVHSNPPDDPLLFHLSRESLTKLDHLIAIGFDPSAICKFPSGQRFLRTEFSNKAIAKDTFTQLVIRGFNFSESDFPIILDEKNDPGLRHKPVLFSMIFSLPLPSGGVK